MPVAGRGKIEADMIIMCLPIWLRYMTRAAVCGSLQVFQKNTKHPSSPNGRITTAQTATRDTHLSLPRPRQARAGAGVAGTSRPKGVDPAH